MVILLPFLLTLAAGVLAVVYMCWQGVKVQQAANLAARIQGQERVAGGVSYSTIQQDNGVNQGGDVDPTLGKPMDTARYQALILGGQKGKPAAGSVYGKIKQLVRAQFSQAEQAGLFVPFPSYGLVGYSDQVKVVRIWQLPAIFGLNVAPVSLQATAYGGEDSHMYGLVRWGHTNANGSGNLFWAEKDPSHPGKTANLPNPNND
jgi:hypothetical protein